MNTKPSITGGAYLAPRPETSDDEWQEARARVAAARQEEAAADAAYPVAALHMERVQGEMLAGAALATIAAISAERDTMAHESDIRAAQLDAAHSIIEAQMRVIWSERREKAALRAFIRAKRLNDHGIGRHGIADIIGRVVDLAAQPDGMTYVGACPFCAAPDDTLIVHNTAGVYYCSECCAVGNAADFIANYPAEVAS